ncbi:uncharacterized protein LOC144436857 [Glandiceps talaboti]
MKCGDCDNRKGSVKLRQGDLMLCGKCNSKRFGKPVTRSDSAEGKMAAPRLGDDIPTTDHFQRLLQPIIMQLTNIATDIQEVKLTQTELNNSMDFFIAKYEEMSTRVETIERANIKLQHENTQLSQQLKIVEDDLASLNQYNRRTNLEVSCVPEKDGEDVIGTVISIFKKTNPAIDENDIDIAHRIGVQNKRGNAAAATTQTRPRPIIVRFTTRKSRNEVYDNRKKLKNTNAKDFGLDSTAKIYINENLLPATRQLLYKVNTQRKQARYQFMWTNNGKIYVKKDTQSRPLIISRETDLSRIM